MPTMEEYIEEQAESRYIDWCVEKDHQVAEDWQDLPFVTQHYWRTQAQKVAFIDPERPWAQMSTGHIVSVDPDELIQTPLFVQTMLEQNKRLDDEAGLFIRTDALRLMDEIKLYTRGKGIAADIHFDVPPLVAHTGSGISVTPDPHANQSLGKVMSANCRAGYHSCYWHACRCNCHG